MRRVQIDYSNREFPTYKVIERIVNRIAKSTGRQYVTWMCLCQCGNKFEITSKQIKRGIRKSCGCLQKANQWKRKDFKDVVTNYKITNYKRSARIRNIDWQLTWDQFKIFIFSNCYYCKSPPTLRFKRHERIVYINGIDRKDSNGNYTMDNCVACCHFCNQAKLNHSIEAFYSWIERLRNAI